MCTVTTTSEAHFGEGTKLTVLDPKLGIKHPTVKILHSPKSEQPIRSREPKKKTLVCVASDFYPDHVTVSWRCSAGRCKEVATDSAALLVDQSYRITSRLTVLAKTWEKPENTFTCNVRFYDGKDYHNYNETIQGVKGNLTIDMQENYLKITQKAKLSYGVVIVKSCAYGAFVGLVMWKLQGSRRKY